jgi:hypothetical protein
VLCRSTPYTAARDYRNFRKSLRSCLSDGPPPSIMTPGSSSSNTMAFARKRLLRRRSNHLIAEAMTVEGRGKALMAAVEQHDLEGIVAKRKSDPYRRGVHWWKIKNRAYSQAEDGRGELLNGDGRAAQRRGTSLPWPSY